MVVLARSEDPGHGWRKGEVLGLTWELVNLDAAELYIGEQVQRVGRELIRRQVKTETSEAHLPLPDLCVAALKLRRGQQEADRGRADGAWIDTGPVFTTRHGTALEPRNFSRSFDRCITELFPTWLCCVNFQGVDYLGELPGAPGAAAEFAEDAPGFKPGVRALAGCAEPGVGAVGLFLRFGFVLSPVRELGVCAALVALIGQGDQAGGLQFGQDAPDPLGLLVVDRAGQRPGHPHDAAVRAGDDLQVHPVPLVLARVEPGAIQGCFASRCARQPCGLPWTPETSAAPGGRKAVRPRACPWPNGI